MFDNFFLMAILANAMTLAVDYYGEGRSHSNHSNHSSYSNHYDEGCFVIIMQRLLLRPYNMPDI